MNKIKLTYFHLKSKYFDFKYNINYFFRYLYFKFLTIEGKVCLIEELKYKIHMVSCKEYICDSNGDTVSSIDWSLENLKNFTQLVEYYQILKYSDDEIKIELKKIRNDFNELIKYEQKHWKKN